MDSNSKKTFTNLSKDDTFKSLIEKVTIGAHLNDSEWSYILACSLVLLDQYDKCKEESYFQFAYYLILNYSLTSGDYKPLYDFSIDAGFFPISSYLASTANCPLSVDDLIIGSSVETSFTDNNIILISQQKEKLDSFLSDTSRYKSLIAPTSYGKSKFIEKDIEEHSFEKKIAVVVPSKALIWQTFNNLKFLARRLKRKILVHDSEYDGEDSFIGIFTQERVLRLIEDNALAFDAVYVDEAHNIFENDDRSILLARFLKINEKNNSNQRVVFLSPLVKQSSNFSFQLNSLISESRINNSIKEYRIKYYDESTRQTHFYNRFINSFISTDEQNIDLYEYILNNSTEKNLIYFYTPKKIERFAKEYCERVTCQNNPELIKLASLIESYSSKDYLLVETIKRGAIYIHSKIPDFLKNFLYDCFNKMPSIKYLISNGCVLEGVDFPISSLFILDGYSLSANKTTNLVGRVNRLRSIFGGDKTDLRKLLCPIHYVDSKKYSSTSVKNKVDNLRKDIKDEVENPVLDNAKVPKNPDDLKIFNEIKSREKSYVNNQVENNVSILLIKNGVDKRYSDFDEATKIIEERIGNYSSIDSLKSLMTAIADIFVKQTKLKSEHMSLGRLKSEEAVRFYYNYLNSVYHGTLKAKISYIKKSIEYAKTNKTSNGKLFVDKAFGTTTLTNREQDNYKAYVDINGLSDKEIINIAIIKSKVEDDFLDFIIAPYAKILLELKLITEDLYNMFLYGTSDIRLISLYKLGLSTQFINFILDKDLLNEMDFLGYGIRVTNRFKEELNKQDEIVQFEIGYYLVD